MVDLFFEVRKFGELTNIELYNLLKLRSKVFVQEQQCAYLDLDDKDQKSLHVLVYFQNHLVAYARILPPGISYPDAVSIGRVIIEEAYRGKKWGYPLIDFCVKLCFKKYDYKKITISAQEHLKAYYEKCGFLPEGQMYLEDNIPHLKMSLKKEEDV